MTNLKRPARALVLALVVAASTLAGSACAGPSEPEPVVAAVPLPAGIAVDVGLDAGGPFYSFVSTLEPDPALAAYARFVGAAGFAPAGSERGWSRFSDGRRVIAARAEPGPPTIVVVRVAAGAGQGAAPDSEPAGGLPSGTPASGPGPTPRATARPTAPPTAGPPSADPPTTPPLATPAPTADAAGRGRQPDPPHGASGGNAGGNGKGNAGGNGKGNAGGNAGGNGKGNAGGKPDTTPAPGGSPRP